SDPAFAIGVLSVEEDDLLKESIHSNMFLLLTLKLISYVLDHALCPVASNIVISGCGFIFGEYADKLDIQFLVIFALTVLSPELCVAHTGKLDEATLLIIVVVPDILPHIGTIAASFFGSAAA